MANDGIKSIGINFFRMRKLYPLLAILLMTITGWPQTRSWNGGNGNWNDKTKWTPIGAPEETDILEFSSASGTISNVPDLTFKGIIFSGCDIVLNAAAGNSKRLTLGNSTSDNGFIIYSDASLTIGTNLDISLAKNSFAVIDGALMVSTNRQFITNVATTKTTVNGTIKNNGGTILSSAPNLEFADGSTYEHAMDKGVIPGATWHKNSNCNITGVLSTAPTGLDQSFGNFKWHCLQQEAGILSTIAIPSDIKGDLIINQIGETTAPSIFITLPGKVNIDGNFILNSGTCLVKGTTANINLAGNFIMMGGTLKAIATTTNAVINFNFSGNQKQLFFKSAGTIEKSNGSIAKAEIKFTVLENAVIDFGESVLNGDASFTLSKGSRLITAHADGIATEGAIGSIQVTGTRTFSSQADYAYNGSAHQKTGSGLPYIVRKLIIDNNAGVLDGAGIELSKPVAISEELLLENGFLKTLATNMLIIMDGAKATAFNNSFVEGPIRKAGNTAFVFPTGWSGAGGGLVPIGISSVNTNVIIQAEYKRAPATSKGTTINAPLHHISYCEYWELFPVTGNPTAIVTMYRNAHSTCNPVSIVQDFSTIRVARSDGYTWTDLGNEDASINGGTGYVISDSAGTNINVKERYFTLANISSAKDPLPVMFDGVTAYEKNGGVNIEWSNLTERDIATYFVERSVNGKDYSVISQHLPKSNKDDKASYISFDPYPAQGTNFYRVKTIEKNTKIIFSRIMRVETDKINQRLTLYPNPLTGSHFTLSLSGIEEGKYHLDLFNSAGQVVYQKDIISHGSFTTQSFDLPNHIKTGFYNVLVKGDRYQQSKIFIVQ